MVTTKIRICYLKGVPLAEPGEFKVLGVRLVAQVPVGPQVPVEQAPPPLHAAVGHRPEMGIGWRPRDFQFGFPISICVSTLQSYRATVLYGPYYILTSPN